MYASQDLFGLEAAGDDLPARGKVLPIGKGRIVKEHTVPLLLLLILLLLLLKYTSYNTSCRIFLIFIVYILLLLHIILPPYIYLHIILTILYASYAFYTHIFTQSHTYRRITSVYTNYVSSQSVHAYTTPYSLHVRSKHAMRTRPLQWPMPDL